MLNFINKFFKKDDVYSYTIAEYQPKRINHLRTDVLVNNLQELTQIEHDEMEIDHLYEKS